MPNISLCIIVHSTWRQLASRPLAILFLDPLYVLLQKTTIESLATVYKHKGCSWQPHSAQITFQTLQGISIPVHSAPRKSKQPSGLHKHWQPLLHPPKEPLGQMHHIFHCGHRQAPCMHTRTFFSSNLHKRQCFCLNARKIMRPYIRLYIWS